MDDLDKITVHIGSLKPGEVVSDACAHLIARLCSDMCRGRWTSATAPIAAFAHAGAVVDGIEHALQQMIAADPAMPLESLTALGALPDYLHNRRYAGRTEPVDGWSTLSL